MNVFSVVPVQDCARLNVQFVISDCPHSDKLKEYATIYASLNVVTVVRICSSSTYDSSSLLQSINSCYLSSSIATESDSKTGTNRSNTENVLCFIDDIHFEDGGIPTIEQIEMWLSHVDSVQSSTTISDFLESHKYVLDPKDVSAEFSSSLSYISKEKEALNSENTWRTPSIAVHCVSGLGRAPILVAIAILANFPKMDVLDVISLVRKYRRGALNSHQMKWLEDDFDKKFRRKLTKSHYKSLHSNNSRTLSPTSSSPSPSPQKSSLSIFKRLKNGFKKNKSRT